MYLAHPPEGNPSWRARSGYKPRLTTKIGWRRGGVSIDQDHAISLFAEGAHGLRAAVVELGRLADDDGPGAEDEDALQVGAPGHLSRNSSYVREDAGAGGLGD